MKKIYLKSIIAVVYMISALNLSAASRIVNPGEDIQDAIDYVAENGGGTVTLASGTHSITTSLKMKSNVTLQGEGNQTSHIYTSENIKIIEADSYGLVNIKIENLELEGTNQIDGGGIDIISYGTDHSGVEVVNVHCHNTGWGVHIKGAENVTIEDCIFEYNGTVGKEYYAHNLYLRRCTTTVVQNSKFLNSISSNGINISYSVGIEIYNCEISGNYFRGVRAANTQGFLVHDCVISNNGHGSSDGGDGIIANSEGVATTGCDFRRNCISNNASSGIYGVSAAAGLAYDNNSYGNATNYNLPSGFSTSGNESNANQPCGSLDFCGGFDAYSKIEAEDYCDQSGVNTEQCSEGGENVGWIDDDDWIMFKNVDFGYGAESVEARVSSRYTGGTIEFRLGSISGTLIGTANVNVTSGWQNWETVTCDIDNASGIEDLYLIFTDGGININWIEFTEGTVCPNFSTIQAEDFADMSGIVNEGSNIGFIHNGDWVKYSNVDLTCAASLSVNASSSTTGGSVEVRLGSSTGTLIGTVVISSTGSWNNWAISSSNIRSVEGIYDVYLVFTGGSGYLFNIDWLEFSMNTTKSANLNNTTSQNPNDIITIYPNPAYNSLFVTNSSGAKLEVFTTMGSRVLNQTIDDDDAKVDISSLKSGMYIIKIHNKEISKTKQIIKK